MHLTPQPLHGILAGVSIIASPPLHTHKTIWCAVSEPQPQTGSQAAVAPPPSTIDYLRSDTCRLPIHAPRLSLPEHSCLTALALTII